MYTTRTIPLQDAPWHPQATIYEDESIPVRAQIFYLHGGGLLYGSREDLPERHRSSLTSRGFRIIALDYPLAPAMTLSGILPHIRASIRRFLPSETPWFLWGRSSGGWLALLTAVTMEEVPAGILSYYGYGMLTDGWIDTPSAYYNAMMKAHASCLENRVPEVHCTGPVETHFLAYVYARQTGLWKSLILGNDPIGENDFTLRGIDALPCPLFCTHAAGDPDVPFAEFQALVSRYHPEKYITAGEVHDFDREEDSWTTKKLLDKTVHFLESHI